MTTDTVPLPVAGLPAPALMNDETGVTAQGQPAAVVTVTWVVAASPVSDTLGGAIA